MEGYIQVYTGNGKGKTTSALGLSLRAAGAGKKIFFGQFLKSGNYSEVNALKLFSKEITLAHYGLGIFVKGKPSREDREAAVRGYDEIRGILQRGEHDLVILDEGNVAVAYGVISEQDLLSLFDIKPDHVELVVTGRGATKAVMDRADLVVEMSEVKHYYQKGVKARIGIEK